MDSDPLEFARRLRTEHQWFDTRLVVLRGRANTYGWQPLRGSWTAFAADLERHFEFEESSVFPAFVRHRPLEGVVVRRLLDQHAELLRMLQQLTLAMTLDQIGAGALDDFAAAMGEHESLENSSIDPWLEQQGATARNARTLTRPRG